VPVCTGRWQRIREGRVSSLGEAIVFLPMLRFLNL
jgi:hypothetical protein